MKKLFGLVALLTAACRPCEKLPLAAADRAWLAAYPRIGPTLTFRGSRGHSAVFTVTERVDTYSNLDCNRFEIGTSQPAHLHVTLRPRAFAGGGRHDLTVYLTKWDAQQPATLDFRLAGLEAYFHEQYNDHRLSLQPKSCTLATGRVYLNAYYFEAGINAIDYGGADFRAFYWDQQAGLIRYELPDGEVFELVGTQAHSSS